MTRLFPALILCLGLLGACRRSLPVCSAHGDCPGGLCILGGCQGPLDGAVDAAAVDALGLPAAWDGPRGEAALTAGDGGDVRGGDVVRRDVVTDGREVGDARVVDADRVDAAPDVALVEDSARDTPPDSSRQGPIGFVRSTTGTALPLRVQGLQVYLGDWGLAPGGAAARGNLQTYDVSEPTRPVLRDNFYPCSSECELSDIAGDNSVLYVGSHGMGVFAFNMLGPARSPLSERLVNPTGSAPDNVSAVALATVGLSTFLLVGQYTSGELKIYDVTTDSALATPWVIYKTVSDTAQSLHAIEVAGTAAYLFAGVSAGELIEIVDLSSLPAGGSPIALGRYPWARRNSGDGAGGGYGRMRFKDGFLYIAASALPEEGVRGGLRILDVSNPANPRFVRGFDLEDIGNIPGRGPGVDVDESGKWAFVVTSKGLQLIDISVPTMPLVRGPQYDFPGEFLPCFGGRAVYSKGLVYVTALCRSDDGSMGRGGLAIYLVP